MKYNFGDAIAVTSQSWDQLENRWGKKKEEKRKEEQKKQEEKEQKKME